MHAVAHSTFKTVPGGSVFHRDMMLDLPLIADLHRINERRQELIDQRAIEANRKRMFVDCQPNDEVVVLTCKPAKLEPRAHGPFRVLHTHANGTVTVRRNNAVTERMNVRRIKPHRRWKVLTLCDKVSF